MESGCLPSLLGGVFRVFDEGVPNDEVRPDDGFDGSDWSRSLDLRERR
jgi:hypothetical protein